jgi:hypothetical protein
MLAVGLSYIAFIMLRNFMILLMLIILFFFSSFHEFAYDHICFCVYVYLWIYLSHVRENIWPLSFWTWLTLLNMMSSNCIHLPSDHMVSLFLMCE